ncbi:Putative aliphatic sulfonates transport permease protein SsuC [Methylobacterium crusticola]|uniref:Aliphatic sulfonates transport permease protein SsuC n=1 Tax=Methylobacterium crusticola TaxID=1697972 RepID=A0ABQ4R1V8_9HYPH|nr:ABC transporter permease subunit [Methylobacterium crusticola]GJD51434.1 Putative aliphatic sulfonates transport permease protein SsuC [Methylobacterium crusticola]
MRRLPAGLPPLLALAGLLAAWEVASRFLALDGLPSVPATLAALPDLVADPDFARNLLASLRRMATGFCLALALALPAGLAMGRSRTVAALLNPLTMMVYPVPKAALMPLIMLWLGVGDLAKTLVIVLGVSLPVLYHAYQGARAVEEKMLWSAAAMGLSGPARAARVVLPAALPEILVGCRTGIVLALITMATSEMIARQSGIGAVLFNALDLAQYETVYAIILVIGALGVGLDVLFEGARARLVGWAGPPPALAPASA